MKCLSAIRIRRIRTPLCVLCPVPRTRNICDYQECDQPPTLCASTLPALVKTCGAHHHALLTVGLSLSPISDLPSLVPAPSHMDRLLAKQWEPNSIEDAMVSALRPFVSLWSESSVRNLAATYQTTARQLTRESRFEAATHNWEKAYDLLKKRFPLDRETANVEVELAMAVWRAFRRPAEVLQLLWSALETERSLGAHADTVLFLSNLLSEVLIETGDLVRAEGVLRALVSPDCDELHLEATSTLAWCLLRRKDTAEAERLLRGVLLAADRLYPYVTAEALKLLGCALMQKRSKGCDAPLEGDTTEIEACYARAVELYRPLDNEDTAAALHDLGDFYARQRRFHDARRTLEAAVALLKARTGASFKTAQAIRRLGDLYVRVPDFHAAIQQYRECTEILRRENFSECCTARAFARLGQCFAQCKYVAEAQNAYFQALALLKDNVYAHSPCAQAKRMAEQRVETFREVLSLFAQLRCSGRKAETLLVWALDQKTLDASTELVAGPLADAYVASKQYKKLHRLHEQLLAVDPASSLVAKTTLQLFASFSALRQYGAAEALLKEGIRALTSRKLVCPLLPKLYARLISLFAAERRHAAKATMKKYGLVDPETPPSRPHFRPYFEVLVQLENHTDFKRIDQEVASLCDGVSPLLETPEYRSLDTVECLLELGKFFQCRKDFHRAEKWLTLGLATAKDVRTQSPFVVDLVLKLAKVYKRTGRSSEPLYTDAVLRSLMPASVRTAILLVRLGDLYKKAQSYDQAEEQYSKALSMVRSLEPACCDYSSVLMRQAMLCLATNRRDKGKQKLEKAVSVLKTIDPSSRKVALSWQELVDASADLQQDLALEEAYDTAKTTYSRQEARFSDWLVGLTSPRKRTLVAILTRELSSPDILRPQSRWRAAVAVRVGDLYVALEQHEAAETYYLQAFAVYQALATDPVSLTTVACKLTAVYYFFEDYKKLLETLQAALPACQSDPQMTARLLEEWGNGLRLASPYYSPEAAQRLRSAYSLLKTHSPEESTRVFNALIGVYEALEEYEKVEKLFIEHSQVLGTHSEAAALHWSKAGRFHHQHGRFHKAEASYYAALDIYRRTEAPDGCLQILTQLGTFLHRSGQSDRAEAYFSEAAALIRPEHLTVRRSVPSSPPWVPTYSRGSPTLIDDFPDPFSALIAFYEARKQFAKAEALFKQLLAMQAPGAGVQETLSLLGDFYVRRNRIEDAEDCFKEMVALYASGEHSSDLEEDAVAQLADFYAVLGDYDRQGQVYQEAIKRGLGDTGDAHTVLRMAEMYRKLKRLPQAEDCFKRALALAHRAPASYLHTKGEILQLVGGFYHSLGRREDADICFQTAAKGFLRPRSRACFEASIYDDLVKYWKDTKQSERLQAFIDQLKAKKPSHMPVHRRRTPQMLEVREEFDRESSFYRAQVSALSTLANPGDRSSHRTAEYLANYSMSDSEADRLEARLLSELDGAKLRGACHLAAAHCKLADFYFGRNKQAAETHYLRALEVLRHLGPTCVYTRETTLHLASLYRVHSEYEAAESLLKGLEALLQRTDAWFLPMASVQRELGEIYMRLHRLPECEAALRRSVEIFSRLDMNRTEPAYALTNLGLLYRQLSRDKEAENSFKRSILLQNMRMNRYISLETLP